MNAVFQCLDARPFTISELYEGVGMEFLLLSLAFFEVQKGIDSLRANWGNRGLGSL